MPSVHQELPYRQRSPSVTIAQTARVLLRVQIEQNCHVLLRLETSVKHEPLQHSQHENYITESVHLVHWLLAVIPACRGKTQFDTFDTLN